MADVQELRARSSRLRAQLEASGGTDAAYVADVQRAAVTAKEGADRWTDNIFVCRSYAEKKLSTDRSQFHEGLKQLGIKRPDALDYVE